MIQSESSLDTEKSEHLEQSNVSDHSNTSTPPRLHIPRPHKQRQRPHISLFKPESQTSSSPSDNTLAVPGVPLLSATRINRTSQPIGHSRHASGSSHSSSSPLKLSILDPVDINRPQSDRADSRKGSSSNPSSSSFTPIPQSKSALNLVTDTTSASTDISEAIVVDLNISEADASPMLIENFRSAMRISEPENPSSLKPITKDIEQLTEADWKLLSETDQIRTLEVLGEGNGGSVKKCRLESGKGQVFALKTITADPSPEFRKQIVRELNYNRRFKSPYIVKYFGTFLNEADASICISMEYMGGRSLDAIYKVFKRRDGRIGEKPLGKVAEGVLKGLSYLNQQKIMHRDIKPQNILLDSMGNVKLCDFGVSGEVVNSLATTFTGTSFYMAPERIRNEPYTISCDVWSLGLTLLEGAMGSFPFTEQSSSLEISPIDLLLIILEFRPNLQDEPEEGIYWSASFKDFIKVSLTEESRKRPSPRQMLEHPWIKGQMKKKVKMEKLVQYCWGLPEK
ncbi:DEKNAAC104292 [Brettanomyces naardenensis]|uniref:mitogen-activated protein kinase kinase n=1 Tax=Brettanomyces naardenensis TaxID=13370 RepID=A0A448YQB8_BRENA|nr:DEKNAAC104292 [Brettanomyces naardenensis]